MIHVAQRIAAELEPATSSACCADGGWKYLSTDAWADDLATAEKGVEDRCGGSAVGDDRPIGVFDSGVGGLTVARAILDLLPNEAVVYLGDGAHFPYGPSPSRRSAASRWRSPDHLSRRGVKLLVVACNSVEVSAIGDIAAARDVPVARGDRTRCRAPRSGPPATGWSA